jgi:hypothetical protein
MKNAELRIEKKINHGFRGMTLKAANGGRIMPCQESVSMNLKRAANLGLLT